jgi:hypothetical protein
MAKSNGGQSVSYYNKYGMANKINFETHLQHLVKPVGLYQILAPAAAKNWPFFTNLAPAKM